MKHASRDAVRSCLNAQNTPRCQHQSFDVVEKPLSAWAAASTAMAPSRKTSLLVVLALLWEAYARWLNNPLLFPTFTDTVKALFTSIASGEIPRAAAYSIGMLLKGYVAGLLLAALLTAFASATSHRRGSSRNTHRDVQSAALDRAAASGADLVRAGRRQRDLRADPRRALGRRAQHARGISRRQPDARRWSARITASRSRLRDRAFCSPAAFPSILTGLKVGLGLRVAHIDRRRTGFRCEFRLRRTWLVHLRTEESASDSERLRRPADGDSASACSSRI